MNKHSKQNNLLLLLFSLVLLTSFMLVLMWGHDAENGIYYAISKTSCAGVLMMTGSFLLFLPSQKQNQFIKESFLIRFMNQREKEGDFFNLLFRGGKRIFGLFWIIFGLVIIFSLY